MYLKLIRDTMQPMVVHCGSLIKKPNVEADEDICVVGKVIRGRYQNTYKRKINTYLYVFPVDIRIFT